MVRAHDLVVWLKDVDKNDVSYVGGKSANLGEMIQAKFPVPGGFALTAHAYFTFLKENALNLKITHILSSVDYDNPDVLSEVSKNIKRLMLTSSVPQDIVKSVFHYYERLGSNLLVAVRSSATSEDSKTASFAGQQETYLNVSGEAALIHTIREAWASLFGARAIFYRHDQKIDHMKTGISLVVQKMVHSDASGVMFTVDPVTNDKTKIIIDAIWGLGEYIVQGKVTPDHYVVTKERLAILEKEVAHQSIMLKKVGNANKQVTVGRLERKKQKISDSDIVALAQLGRDIERHYYFPQDIEWAKEKGKLYIVQTRPITTLGRKKTEEKTQGLSPLPKTLHPILMGEPASPGIGTGPVRIITKASQIGKIRQGDVLVAPYTSPDYVTGMRKTSAIVTEKGGRTSHAAIVSREFGIPAVVGTGVATKRLKDDMVITVNGSTGEIFKGGYFTKDSSANLFVDHIKTATKVYANISEPEVAIKVSGRNVDGIGLLRAEFMIAQIGIHPRKLIKERKEKLFVEKMSQSLETICNAFYPRPVYYRSTDFKTNEYRNLLGGKEFEPVEPNPMLGYRGAFRYVNDPKVFNLELEVVKYIREKKELQNLHLMIPFVRTPEELAQVKKLITKSSLSKSHSFQLIMMVEIPSNVILIEDFIREGIDGVSIGSNDLTMLLLGTDRDNEEVAIERFDERNDTVLWAIERVIKTCKKHGVKSSICGQAPSLFPDLVEKLVQWGITSISVSADAIDSTRATIHRIEKKMKSAQ